MAYSCYDCVDVRILHKKVSAVAASADGCWALAADKFGDVYAAPLLPDQPEDKSAPAGNIYSRAEPEVTAPATAPSETAASGAQARSGRTGDGQTASAPAQAGPGHGVKAAVLLSHYNATVTSLTVSADGSSLVSTDRDGKARVSVFPSRPLQVTTRSGPAESACQHVLDAACALERRRCGFGVQAKA